MADRDPVEQLRILNELLANSGASAPECATHARHALDFFSNEQASASIQISLCECIDRLACLHLGVAAETRELAFAHWHVPTIEHFSPLWIRQAIVLEMKKLAGCRAALLLVTGLREAVGAEGVYWTRKRQQHYDRIRTWIDALACAWATRSLQLQVVVL